MATDLDTKIKELESKPNLSDFESQRLTTLRENRELFASLGLGPADNKKRKLEAKENLSTGNWLSDSGYEASAEKLVRPPQPAKKTRAPAKKRDNDSFRAKVEPQRRTRYSLRVRGIDAAPESGLEVDGVNTSLKTEDDEKERRVSGPISFDANSNVVTTMNGLAATDNAEYKLLVKESESDVKEWRERYGALCISLPNSSMKATKERIYCSAWHPQTDVLLYCVGDKAGNLSIINYSETKRAVDNIGPDYEPTIFSSSPHSGTISSIKFSTSDACKMYTSSYDGSVRLMDLEKQQFSEVFVHPDETWLTCIEFEADFRGFYFSDGLGFLGYKDLREAPEKANYSQFSAKKLNTVSLHPTSSNYLLTCGLARKVELFDVRMSLRGKKKVNEEELLPVVSYEQHSKSVNSAYWTSNGNNFITTSYDDTVKSWPSPITANGISNDSEPSGIHSVRHNNRTGKWVTNFKATPHPYLPLVVIGNMARIVDIYHASTMQSIAVLKDSALTAVPAVNSFHPNPSLDLIGSGNASGKVTFWN